MDQLKFVMPKEEVLDHHIHLHTHDLLYKRRLSPRRGPLKRLFSGVLSGLILGACIFGAAWFEWWK